MMRRPVENKCSLTISTILVVMHQLDKLLQKIFNYSTDSFIFKMTTNSFFPFQRRGRYSCVKYSHL